jgi:hypothetical protein
VSNGRIFYISQASGMEVSQVWGKQASTFVAPWKRK